MDAELPALPIGHSGRLEAAALTNTAGNHAVLVREADAPRALLTTEEATPRARLVVTPLDDDVELRVDGDALAVWLTQGSVAGGGERVPAWANALGFALLLLLVIFVVVGGATVAGWLVSLAGGGR